MPLVPSGMRVKLSLPTAFCAVVKVQWALPVTCRSPLGKGQGRAQGGGHRWHPQADKAPPCWADHGDTNGSWALGHTGDGIGWAWAGCRWGRDAQVLVWHRTHLDSRVLR